MWLNAWGPFGKKRLFPGGCLPTIDGKGGVEHEASALMLVENIFGNLAEIDDRGAASESGVSVSSSCTP